MCVRCVARLARAAKNKSMYLWYYGQMVRMPDFGFDGVSSSLAESMSIYILRTYIYIFYFFFSQLFFQLFCFCIMYVTRTPQTTDSTRAVQGACLNHLATTLYTRCRPPAEQEATPHACGSLSALCYCGFLLIVAFVIGPCDL